MALLKKMCDSALESKNLLTIPNDINRYFSEKIWISMAVQTIF